jgi:hypothetical protein
VQVLVTYWLAPNSELVTLASELKTSTSSFFFYCRIDFVGYI